MPSNSRSRSRRSEKSPSDPAPNLLHTKLAPRPKYDPPKVRREVWMLVAGLAMVLLAILIVQHLASHL